MSHIEENFEHDQNVHSGNFLEFINPLGSNQSTLASAVTSVAEYYFDNGNLSFALQLIKDGQIQTLSDYWQNGALSGLGSSSGKIGFNDTTSGGENRTKEQYLLKVIHSDRENSHNTDSRFVGYRPLGFRAEEDVQPVMALVALDPSLLDSSISQEEQTQLIDEIRQLRLDATDFEPDIRDSASEKMSGRLQEVLSSCLLANNTIVDARDNAGAIEKWVYPFDLIAGLKALYILLTGEKLSATMRQGAVRISSISGKEIIVGCSGLNSAIDEMVARNFARDVLNKSDFDNFKIKLDTLASAVESVTNTTESSDGIGEAITRRLFESNLSFTQLAPILKESFDVSIAQNEPGIIDQTIQTYMALLEGLYKSTKTRALALWLAEDCWKELQYEISNSNPKHHGRDFRKGTRVIGGKFRGKKSGEQLYNELGNLDPRSVWATMKEYMPNESSLFYFSCVISYIQMRGIPTRESTSR